MAAGEGEAELVDAYDAEEGGAGGGECGDDGCPDGEVGGGADI